MGPGGGSAGVAYHVQCGSGELMGHQHVSCGKMEERGLGEKPLGALMVFFPPLTSYVLPLRKRSGDLTIRSETQVPLPLNPNQF